MMSFYIFKILSEGGHVTITYSKDGGDFKANSNNDIESFSIF